MPSRATRKIDAAVIAHECKLRNWSYADLARKAVVSQATLTHILKDGRPAEIRTVAKLAKALDVPESLICVTPPRGSIDQDEMLTFVWRVRIPNHEPTVKLLMKLIKAVSTAMGYADSAFTFESHSEGSVLIEVSGVREAISSLLSSFEGGQLNAVPSISRPVAHFEELIFPAAILGKKIKYEKTMTIERTCYYVAKDSRGRLRIRYDAAGALHLINADIADSPEPSPAPVQLIPANVTQ